MTPKLTHAERKAWFDKNEEWGEREGNETTDACGAWTIEPIGLDVLGDEKDHADSFTAIHEAGHAVADHVLGQTPDKVTIEPNHEEGAAGHASQSDGDDMTEEGTRALVVALLAGEGASLLAGEAAEIASEGAASDQDKAEEYIYGLRDTEDERVSLLRDLRDETEALLRNHWSKLGLVARFLLKHTTLDDDDLSSLLESNDEREAEDLFEEGRALNVFRSGVSIDDLTPEQCAAINRYQERCKEDGPKLRRAIERLSDNERGR